MKIDTKKSVTLLRPEINFQLYFPQSFSDLREIRYAICIYSSSTFAGIVKLGAGMYVLYLWTLIKLHSRVYRETLWQFEIKCAGRSCRYLPLLFQLFLIQTDVKPAELQSVYFPVLITGQIKLSYNFRIRQTKIVWGHLYSNNELFRTIPVTVRDSRFSQRCCWKLESSRLLRGRSSSPSQLLDPKNE